MTAPSWVAYCDGASRGNPGPAAFGLVVLDPSGRRAGEWGIALGVNTNQVAEYEGVIRALKELRALGARRAVVKTDSQFVVRQFTGEYRAKDERMKALLARARGLAADFESLTLRHIARSSEPGNVRADDLANRALDAGGTGAAETSI